MPRDMEHFPVPEPLVSPEVDLRGFGWMPYYGDHLARSEFNAKADDASFRAGHNLWWAAWNCVPAGSLPNDDDALTRFADLGRDVKSFRKIRAKALHGFILCNDGRWYHPFLAKLAIEAWDRRVKERERKQRWRDGKERPGDGDKNVPPSGTGGGTETPPELLKGKDRTGQDRTGQEKTANANTVTESNPDKPNPLSAGLPKIKTFGSGVSVAGSQWGSAQARDEYASTACLPFLPGADDGEKWAIVLAADSPDDPNYSQACRLMRDAAKKAGVGWKSPHLRGA